jgi:uncharacterized oxidoreductase
MKTSKNTVLITGGSAGIGFEMAKLMLAKENKVIITGRDEKRLSQAANELKGVIAIKSDVSNEKEMDALVTKINAEHPDLNILVNNAGRAEVYPFLDSNSKIYDIAKDEMQTNYFSIIRLVDKFLPLLKKQVNPAIVNVSSILALAPGRIVTYSASKAALHSYTQALRLALEEESNIKVFELMPPLVNTDLSKDIGGANGIHPSAVAEELINGLENDVLEIHVGQTADFYKAFFASSNGAARYIFGSRKVAE